MRSARTKEMNLTRRVATLVTLFALMGSLIPPARPLQVSALAHGADAFGALAAPAAATHLTPEQAREAYGRVGMSFEANHGQSDEQVKFIARGSGYTLFLTPAEAVFVLARRSGEQAESRADSPIKENTTERIGKATASEPPAVLRMKLERANRQPAVSGQEELAGKVNYFIGNDPDQWHTDVPTFGRVRYAGVYEGVDMVYYGNQQQLEYDFVVAPGASYRHN